MVAGGKGNTDTNGLLQPLVNNITLTYPGSDEYIVPYNGSATEAKQDTPVMIQALNSYVAACPNTPVVFLGYSLGAVIVMNTLCGGVPAGIPNVIAAISFGEETFVGGQTYDRGTCANNAVCDSLVCDCDFLLIHVQPTYPRANYAACAPYASVIHSYCDATDPQCCTGGTNLTTHFTYATFYDDDAMNCKCH